MEFVCLADKVSKMFLDVQFAQFVSWKLKLQVFLQFGW